MHDPKDLHGYVKTRLEQFLVKWEANWKESISNYPGVNSLEDYKKVMKRLLTAIKKDVDVLQKIRKIMSDYQHKYSIIEADIFRDRKKAGLPLHWYFHDLIHLFVNIISIVNWHQKWGIMPQYLDTDYTDGRIVCVICSMQHFEKTACIEYEYYEKPRLDTWCWREHNLIGKEAWRDIPKENYIFNPRADNPFSEVDKKYAVDTLNKKREELESILT
jgi:hypothetical protein